MSVGRWLLGFSLLLSANAQEAALHLREQYSAGDTLHLVIENTGTMPRSMTPGDLRRVSDNFAPPLWWSRAVPEILPTGGLARVSFSARRPAQLQGDYDLSLGDARLRVQLAHSPTASGLVLGQMVDLGDVLALFVENHGAEPLHVDRITVNGAILELDSSTPAATLLPCDKGVILAQRADAAEPWMPDQEVMVGLGSAKGMQYRHGFVLRAPVFSVRQGEIVDAFICPTHRYGPMQQAARTMLSLPRNHQGLQPEAHFCRNRLPEGLSALGQCLPRAIVNAQGSNPERGSDAAWRGLGEVLDHARTRVQPGIFSAMLEPGSNFDGHFGQATNAPVDPISPRDLQYTVYTALAHGASGLVFRLGDAPAPEYFAMVENLTAQFAAIRPWITALVPITLAATTDDPTIEVTTLFAGRRAALVLLRRAPGVRQTNSDTYVAVQRPLWFTPTHTLEVGGLWRESIVPEGAAEIGLDHLLTEDVALVLLRGE